VLTKLVEVSIRFRGIVVALACLVVGYGAYATWTARYDVYPEFAPPQVVVQTEAPGLSPEDVEQLVTRPVENVLNGAPDVEAIRSQSIQGLSVVTVVFLQRTDVYRARQMVNERIAEASVQMPQGVLPPAMAPLTGATSVVLIIGLTSDQRSLMDVRTFADWTLRPRLLGVPGVARVSTFGGDVRELQVQVEPERLAAYHLSFSDVMTAAKAATGVRGAGFIETPTQRVVVQTQGQSLSAAKLGEVVLHVANNRTARLKDVAVVADGAEPKIGDATIMGRPGVMLNISSQYGANTMDVTRALDAAIAEMAPVIAANQLTLHRDLFRPANFIRTSVRSISTALLIGGVLVTLVLLVFLFNLRVAFISLTAIPLSLLVAIIVLTRMGESLNTLTLGGLAIAIGEVVDDAIIDAENIFRRLREAPRNLNASQIFHIVLHASVEVRSAVVYATFIVALVFIPVLTMSGVQGRLFAPLGWTYILAILASLLVALTVTPALSYLLLPKAIETAKEPPYVVALKARYGRWLHALSDRPRTLMISAGALCVLAIAAVPFLGGEFLPPLREGHFIVHMVTLPGTALPESMRLGALVSTELLKNPNVRLVAQQIGRAEQGDDTAGVHYSEIHVDLKPLGGSAAEQAETDVRDALERIPGALFSTKTFLTERIEEVVSGARAQVVVQVFGDDLDVIDQKAQDVLRLVASVPGAVDTQLESPAGTPELVIRLRPEALRQFGFQPVNVLEAIQAAYQGATVGQAYDGNRVFNVVGVLAPGIRQHPDRVGQLPLQNLEGVRVPLQSLADVYETSGRYSIAHEGSRRRQAIFCDVGGRDLASFVADLQQTLRTKMQFPQGVYAVVSGASEALDQARREIFAYSLVAAIGIVLLLSIAFRNIRNTLLVLANLPFALVGGVLAAVATGGNLSVGSMVGFVTLFGITTRNSIMMISHFEHLVRHERETWGIEAAVRGASERLTPVLMTAIVTALGLLPLALGSGEPGKEIEGPMAIVILGGLVTSTVLNLIVLPTLALRYGHFPEMDAED
jgi:CzcA family heavy metal efflux pump